MPPGVRCSRLAAPPTWAAVLIISAVCSSVSLERRCSGGGSRQRQACLVQAEQRQNRDLCRRVAGNKEYRPSFLTSQGAAASPARARSCTARQRWEGGAGQTILKC